MALKPRALPGGAAAGSILMATGKDPNALVWDPQVQIGYLSVAGDSHWSDNAGIAAPDYGVAHKIDGFLAPATYRNIARAGQVQCWHQQGNGALGDGGWAAFATEFDRQEQVYSKGATTSTGAYSAPNAPVTERTGFLAGEWVVWGTGTTTEIVQIAQSYAGATGAGNIPLAAAPVQTHASGDPFYHACRNEGYLAKDSLVIIGAGYNDAAVLGPFQQGTFGTTRGASRGLGPYQHALRFSLAQARCSVIYRYDHVSCIYTGTWNAFGASSSLSYPPTFAFGAPSGGGPSPANTALAYTQVSGSTVSFSTPPDFAGGTVDIFLMAGNDGAGTQWQSAVAGATTVGNRNVLNTVAQNAKSMNDVADPTVSTAKHTGCVWREKNLNPGVNTITITSTTNGTGWFLGWGMEAPSPPLIFVMQEPRTPLYTGIAGAGYGPRTFGGTGASVTAGHGAAAGEVTFVGATLTLGVAGTVSTTAAQEGDTITIGTGATRETRRIVGFTGSPATACQVDANFVNAHTNEAVIIGWQDADVVGGGYQNLLDTQGKTSVPGLAAAITSIVAEFDTSVIAFSVDTALTGGPGTAVDSTNFCRDGLHLNEKGSGAVAGAVYQTLLPQPWTIPQIASPTVPNKRTWLGVYGDVGASPASSGIDPVFQNGWTNYYPQNANFARVGYYKDMRTRYASVHGAVTGGSAVSGNVIFALPAGYYPKEEWPLDAYVINEDGTLGPAQVVCWFFGGGVVYLGGYPGATGILVFSGTWPCEM